MLSKVEAAAAQTNTSARSGLFSSVVAKVTILSLLLFAITLFLYEPVKNHNFINYDDNAFVTDNPHIATGFTWDNLLWAFNSTGTSEYWHPLTWLSHMLDCALFGLNPAGHHFMNLLVHGINVVLVLLLLQRGTRFTGRSFFVAFLFAIHPVNVQSVAWVAERKNILCATFWLLAIGAYGWYTFHPTWKRYAAVAGLFLFAIMSKPMAVTLPCVLVLLDYWPLRRISFREKRIGIAGNISRLLVEKLLLVPLIVLSCVMTWKAQSQVGVIDSLHLPLSFRIENALTSYWAYVSKWFC